MLAIHKELRTIQDLAETALGRTVTVAMLVPMEEGLHDGDHPD